jgi:SAM-dependent methyltransferase
MNATDVQLSQPVSRTPDSIMDRYRENRHWRLYEKEWIYRQFPPAGKTWLDFGCGTGEITTQLAQLGADRVVAIDVAVGLVDMTRKKAQLDGVSDRVHAICGDINELSPEPVDIVLAFAVLHHVPDRLEQFTKTIVRWLKPGGTFIFCEPICYLPALVWLRNHSGVSRDPLDPGERQLTSADLQLIESHFESSERIHFHTLGRLRRIAPSFDHRLRRLDAGLRNVPAARLFSGSVIGVCRKPKASDGVVKKVVT